MKDPLAQRPPARAQLLLTAGLLSLSVLPHWWNLPPAIGAAFFALVATRLLFWPKPDQVPGLWLRLPLVAAGILLVIDQAGLSEGRFFGVALLVIMAGLKLMELKSRRDLFMAVFLGYFLLITLFLFAQSPALTAYVFLLTLAYTALLITANRSESRLPLAGALGLALRLALGGLPVMLLLFVLFPRLDRPLWSLDLGGGRGITGFSDHIDMGSIADLSLSEEVAFRVRFKGPPPPPEARYWRGLVLWHTDGRHWRRMEAPAHPPRRRPPPDARWQSITMEPSNQPWLFPLDQVVAADGNLLLDADGVLQRTVPVTQRFTYRAWSAPRRGPRELDARQRTLGLQLPDHLSPRLRELVGHWQEESRDPRRLVRRALAYFHQQPFVYTLQPPRLDGPDPVSAFLFDTRAGFCEHYATAFVVLMRLAGLPARVVVGYQGGEINPVGGHLVVRQSDAHAWAEVWLPDVGWQRFDPTAAVAPERIQSPLAPRLAETGAPARFRTQLPTGLLGDLARRLGWYRDNLQLAWHYWIIGYDRDRQSYLLQRLGLGGLDRYQAALLMVLGALALGGLLYLLLGARLPTGGDPVPRAWQRLRRRLARAGLELPANQGPEGLYRAARRRFPHQAGELRRLTDLYVALRYGPHPSRAQRKAFLRAVRRLRLPRA